MHILVTYDVATSSPAGRKRLREVAKTCEDHGQRVQYSVFECSLDRAKLHVLRERLLKIIDVAEDSLRIYHLPSDYEGSVEEHGKTESIDFDGPLIV